MGAFEMKSKSGRGLWDSFFERCKIWHKRKAILTGSYMKSSRATNSRLIVLHQQKNQAYKATSVKSGIIIATVNQRMVLDEAISISGKLENMIEEYHKTADNDTMVRASGNFIMYGHLGNLRQLVAGGNKKEKEEFEEKGELGSLCKAFSRRRNFDKLKVSRDEDIKYDKYGEALTLYEAVIAIQPFKAVYRVDRSTTLEGSGRFLEAIAEIKTTIRLEPHYPRTHHRMKNLYFCRSLETIEHEESLRGSSKVTGGHTRKCLRRKR